MINLFVNLGLVKRYIVVENSKLETIKLELIGLPLFFYQQPTHILTEAPLLGQDFITFQSVMKTKPFI